MKNGINIDMSYFTSLSFRWNVLYVKECGGWRQCIGKADGPNNRNSQSFLYI